MEASALHFQGHAGAVFQGLGPSGLASSASASLSRFDPQESDMLISSKDFSIGDSTT